MIDCQLESKNKQLSLYEGLGKKLWYEEESFKKLGGLEKAKLKWMPTALNANGKKVKPEGGW